MGILGNFAALTAFVFGTCLANSTVAPPRCTSGQYLSGSSCVACGNCRPGPSACNNTTGHCSGGCLDGYDYGADPKCFTACPNGKYGRDCGGTCSTHCTSVCDKVDGTCAPCNPGYQGSTCSSICTSGRWGQNCSKPCGQCDGGVACDKVSGACRRCAAGYKPDTFMLCTRPCDGNMYGQDCTIRCGQCANPQCHHVTGNCLGACKDGYWRLKCTETCSLNCQDSQNCTQSSGFCPCQPGYKPDRCVSICDPGKYGQDCLGECGYCLMGRFTTKTYPNCNNVNGRCDSCEDNREMPFCKDCKAGFWGPRCLQPCGQCGGEGRCRSDSGQCVVSGCQDGWTGSMCDQKCDTGWYGQNCSKPCGRCRDNSACRHDNGVCEQDCQDGYQGVLCQEETQSLVGPIVGGLMGAAVIIAAAIILVGLMRYYRKKQPDRNDGFNTLADIHSVRRNDTSTGTPRQSQVYQNVSPTSASHNNPTFNSDYDRVDRSHHDHDAHAYDSHRVPATAPSQSEHVYQNADATSSRRPVVALKPPNFKKKGKMEKGVEANNTYGNVEFGGSRDGTYGNV